MIGLEPDAKLIGQRHDHPIRPLGWVEWKWEPGKTNVAEIHERFLVGAKLDGEAKIEGNIITVGPYRLRVLNTDQYYSFLLVTPDGWRARLLASAYTLKRAYGWVYQRFMLTLAIWGVTDYTPGMIPSWRDIRIIKRFRR